MPRALRPAPLAALALLLATSAGAQQRLTSPREQFGHDIGADYVLPNYRQMVDYWRKLDGQSDRMTLVDIGRTAEGRTQYMAIVTSPENHRQLERWRTTTEQLAKARVDSAAAQRLAREGKAVVWIDGGLHANEVLGAQQLMETLWQVVSRDDAETRRILDDVVILFVHANPDGMDLVSDWYMRESDRTKRSTNGIPRLYQKYIGHDNNRDFYASTQPETENMNRVLYHRWFPQIVYNHHQTGPTGTVMFAPPFRDPFNYVYDPLIVTGLDLVGAAMHNRFVAEEKGGVTMRRGANYSTWWNGGLRTTTYFHNMIGLLTETIGNPTPMNVPFIANRQIPSADLPLPVDPGVWKFRSSVDYSVTANYAVLDVASRYRETLLMNMWRMGRNSIERGSRDSWTAFPRRLDEVRDSMRAVSRAAAGGANPVMSSGGLFGGAPNPEQSARYLSLLRRPEWRDARGYVIPADRGDFPTATKFVNALRETGVEVHRATARFNLGGESYPEGSYVIWTAQPFRPHVLDMFEPQDHPNDFQYEGGPPIPPYDNAGWTLAYQMGIVFDRILEPFQAPTEPITGWNVAPPEGRVMTPRWIPAGYTLSPTQKDAFAAVNRLLAAGYQVWRVERDEEDVKAGDFLVTGGGRAVGLEMDSIAGQLGLTFEAVHSGRMPREGRRLRAPRIALWDRYGGSMPSGWTRYIFDQWRFPYQVVYAPELDAGNLNAKYDVIVLVSEAVPARDRPANAPPPFGMPASPDAVPAEYRNTLGTVTVANTVPRLREFLENGGTIVTVGSSVVLARHLGLPVTNHLVERAADGTVKELPRDKFFVPGSLLRVAVDTTHPVAWGLGDHVDVMFDESPVMRLGPGAEAAGVRRILWFDSASPLRSGWAWGQQHLNGGVAAAEAKVGRGTLYLFGPEITFRAQPHATFPLLFNALFQSVGETAAIPRRR
ncbi:MAG TPA: M14 metallopeptidase family protein [Longimicrobium sp.]|nr:M14 metallopeptidase family protein [Longimicrobium sp.]